MGQCVRAYAVLCLPVRARDMRSERGMQTGAKAPLRSAPLVVRQGSIPAIHGPYARARSKDKFAAARKCSIGAGCALLPHCARKHTGLLA